MIKIPFKVICINDSDRPNDIPLCKWIKKKENYTVIRMDKMNMQNGMLGFELEEIDLSDCFPYTRFSANRFAIPVDSLEEIEKEIKLEYV